MRKDCELWVARDKKFPSQAARKAAKVSKLLIVNSDIGSVIEEQP